MLRNDDAAFFNYSSYLLYLFLQVRKKASALSGVCKFQGYHCQNSTLIMTNGIRKVKLGVDIFDKRIEPDSIESIKVFPTSSDA